MHHRLAWSRYLLKSIDRDVVQIALTIQVSLLISHHLLEKAVLASFSVLLFQEEVVSRSNLIVFVVLNVRNGLVKAAIWLNIGCLKTVIDFA